MAPPRYPNDIEPAQRRWRGPWIPREDLRKAYFDAKAARIPDPVRHVGRSFKLGRDAAYARLKALSIIEEWEQETDARIGQARVHVASGMSRAEAADKAGLGYDRVCEAVRDIPKESLAYEWTHEASQLANDMYEAGSSLTAICNALGLKSTSVVARHLRARGHYIRPGGIVRLPFHETIFDVLDTPEKRYWLGLLLADGNIHLNRIKLALDEADHTVVEQFRAFMGADQHRIHLVKKRGYGNVPGATRMASITITRKRTASALRKHGIIPRKSRAGGWPDHIPRESQADVVRGFFDGDGTFGTYGGGPLLRFTGNPRLLRGLERVLMEACGLKPRKLIDEGRNIYTLSIGGRLQVERVLRWMTSNGLPLVPRKRAAVHNFLQSGTAPLTHASPAAPAVLQSGAPPPA